MKTQKIKRLVFTALFAALVCVSTLVIRIPTPSTGGYVHLGDTLVILSGLLLGPVWGALAAGIGSALADVLGGYFIYVPITLAIKCASAYAAGFFMRRLQGKKLLPVLLGGLTDALLVAVGYFLYEIPLYSFSAALLSIPANLMQGASGMLLAVIVYPALTAVPDLQIEFNAINHK